MLIASTSRIVLHTEIDFPVAMRSRGAIGVVATGVRRRRWCRARSIVGKPGVCCVHQARHACSLAVPELRCDRQVTGLAVAVFEDSVAIIVIIGALKLLLTTICCLAVLCSPLS